jgi:acyl-CoA thioester hydrolase
VVTRPPPATRADFRAWYRQSTRWADNDVYGHVNNTVYYQWFDSAVNAWLLEQDLITLGGDEEIALVVETRCTFAVPLAYPQDIEVGLAIASLGRSSMRYRIGIFAVGAETAAAEGEFVHVLVGGNDRRPMELPDRWRAALTTLQS